MCEGYEAYLIEQWLKDNKVKVVEEPKDKQHYETGQKIASLNS
jgi:hypothetical protein